MRRACGVRFRLDRVRLHGGGCLLAPVIWLSTLAPAFAQESALPSRTIGWIAASGLAGILIGYGLRSLIGYWFERRDHLASSGKAATPEEFIEQATDAAMILSLDGRIVSANVHLAALMALETDQIAGRRAADVLPPSLMDGMMIGFDTGLESSGTFECTNAAGERLTVNLRYESIDKDGQPVMAITIEDVTEAKRREAELAMLAFTDPLTGLQNRLALTRRMARLADDLAESPEASFAILLMDLNRFKPINDTFGHAAGDKLLAEIGARIRNAVPRNATIVRMGGDEFVVVAGPRVGRDSAIGLAESVIAAVAVPVDIGGEFVSVGISIGIALAPSDSTDPDTLMMGADHAMYRAKTSGCHYALMQDTLQEPPMPQVA